MSGEGWDRDLSHLAASLSRQGTIDPAQAELLQRLAAEVGALTGPRRGREAVVRTAVPLTSEEQARLAELVARRFGPGRRLVFEVDPSVLGGVWLRIGDQIIDGSLRGRLETLRKQMAGRT